MAWPGSFHALGLAIYTSKTAGTHCVKEIDYQNQVIFMQF